MFGGSITDNEETLSGGGICHGGGTIAVSGKVVISGNYKTDGTTPSNLYFPSFKTLTVGALTAGTKIGINTYVVPTTATPVVFTENAIDESNRETYRAYFASDNSAYTIDYNASGKMQLTAPIAHTHDDVTFTAWTATNSLPTTAGNYYLTNDVTLTRDWIVPKENVSICLNGHKIIGTENDDYVICIEETVFNLYDCSDGQGVICASKDYVYGIYIDQGESTFNMYGGTIEGFYNYGVNNYGTFNMYGGAVTDNNGQAGVSNYSGTFNMYGGAILDNVGEYGGVYSPYGDGSVTLSGNISITGNKILVYDSEAGGYVPGDDRNLVLSGGCFVTIGEAGLAEGVKIGVVVVTGGVWETEGYVTGENDSDMTAYFKSDSDKYTITNIDNNRVAFEKKPPDPTYVSVPSGWEGEGTLSSPWIIDTAKDLQDMAACINGNVYTEVGEIAYNTAHYKLGANIDLGNIADWTPIGCYDVNYEMALSFKGSFDGAGYTISNMTIDGQDKDYEHRGLFGHIEKGAVVKNVTLSDVSMVVDYRSGGIAYGSNGIIENCHVISGTIKGKSYIGGIVGLLGEGGIVRNCSNGATVTYPENAHNSQDLGGIAGYSYSGIIENCYNRGPIIGLGREAGIVAYHAGESVTRNCYNIGQITSHSSSGSIAGYIDNSSRINNQIYNCYYLSTDGVGRVYGHNNAGTITNCSAFDSAKDTVSYKGATPEVSIAEALNSYITDNNSSAYLKWEVSEGTNDGYPVFSAPAHTHDNIAFDKKWTATGGTISTNGYYYLADNLTATENITIDSSATVTLCLNGKTLDMGYYYIKNKGTLTICDCQSTQGTIISAHTYSSAIVNYGTLAITGGAINGKHGIANSTGKTLNISGTAKITGESTGISNSGTFTMTGGAVETTGASGYCIKNGNSAKATISGGEVTSANRGISTSGEIIVTGGTVTGYYGIYSDSTSSIITISGDDTKITGTDSHGIFSNGTVNINGGTVSTEGTSSSTYAIYAYGDSCAVTITKGKITANKTGTSDGVNTYNANVTINPANNSDVVFETGGNCIDAGKDSAITVEGGTFTSHRTSVVVVGSLCSGVTLNGGIFETKAANIGVINTHGVLNVTGGTYKSNGGKAIGIYNDSSSDNYKTKVTITGNVALPDGIEFNGKSIGKNYEGEYILDLSGYTGDAISTTIHTSNITLADGALVAKGSVDDVTLTNSGWMIVAGDTAGELVLHEHNYTAEYDETKHWSECGCSDKKGEEIHSFTDGFCVCGVHKHDDGTILMPLTTAGGELDTGNYYLADNLTATENITIPSNKDITLCLNGKTLDMGSYYIKNKGTLTICDCAETEGSITSKNSKDGIISNTETLTINAGNIKYVGDAEYAYSIDNSGYVTVNGGVIDGITDNYFVLKINGGTFTNSGSYSTIQNNSYLYINGGRIENDDACIFNYCANVYLTGGAIISTKAVAISNYDGSTYLSGTPTIVGDETEYADLMQHGSYGRYIYAHSVAGSAVYSGEKLTVKFDSDNSYTIGKVAIAGVDDTTEDLFILLGNENYKLVRGTDENADNLVVGLAHRHNWADDWTFDTTAHWHECEADDCDITEDSQKDGYEVHTPNTDDGDCTTAIKCSKCQAVTTAAKSHAYTYSASGAVITETCSNAGCTHSETATIVKPTGTLTYNGSAFEASVTYSNNWQGGELNISYNDNINAGAVTATITKDSASAGVNYTIEKAQLAKPVADTTVFTYNGSEQTYTIAGNENYTVSGNIQTNADNYVVAVSLKDTANYEWADGSITNLTYDFVIGKADYDMSEITFENAWFTYDGEAHSLAIGGTLPTGADGIQVTVDYSGSATNVAEGEQTVTATFATASTNYNVPTAMTAKVKINPKDISGAVITLGEALTYNGSEQTQTISSVVIDGLNVTYDITNNKQTNVGASDYTLTVTGNGNFTGTANKAWNIAKANAVITVDTTPIVKTYGDVWTLPVASTNFGTVVCDKVIGDLVNAGTYTVTYSVAGTDDYNGDTKTVDVTIEKAAPTIDTIPTASRVTINSTLSASTFTGGVAKGIDGAELTGNFAWKNGTEVLATNGTLQKTVVFTPDSTNYLTFEFDVDVDVYTPSTGGGVTRYTVKFETDGGGTISAKVVSRNAVLDEPTEPVKDGFTFDGWYTDKELTEKYDFSEKVTKSFTLYAKWTENQEEPDENDNTGTRRWNPFIDVIEGDWFYDVVKKAYLANLVAGTSENTFSPNGEITRGMFVTILWNIEGEPDAPKASFTDILDGQYYTKAVSWAYANGIVKGVSETQYAPNANITREQMATILFKYAQFKGVDAMTLAEHLEQFADNDSISEYAVSALNWAVGAGIMSGKGNGILDPLGNATRAEATSVIVGFLDTIK